MAEDKYAEDARIDAKRIAGLIYRTSGVKMTSAFLKDKAHALLVLAKKLEKSGE